MLIAIWNQHVVYPYMYFLTFPRLIDFLLELGSYVRNPDNPSNNLLITL